MAKMKKSEWETILNFSILMTKEALKRNSGYYLDQRVAIIHLAHATELMMKSFLLKNDFLINEVDTKKIKRGVKVDSKIEQFLLEDKTINFTNCLDIVSYIIDLEGDNKRKIKDFYKLRNEIQHRATNINPDKDEKLREFLPILKNLYTKMFPELLSKFPQL